MSRRGADRSDLSARTLRSGHVVMFRSILLALVAATGCAKKASEANAPESRGESMGPADIDALERELAGREAQLRSMGVAVAAVGQAALADERAEYENKGGDAGGTTATRRDLEAREKAAGAEPAAEAPPTTAPSAAPVERQQRSRCETVCELSASICQLQDHICDLVPRHSEEPRYQAACVRATADCRMSTEACHACS